MGLLSTGNDEFSILITVASDGSIPKVSGQAIYDYYCSAGKQVHPFNLDVRVILPKVDSQIPQEQRADIEARLLLLAKQALKNVFLLTSQRQIEKEYDSASWSNYSF